MPPQQQNTGQYDFFMSPEKPSKPSLLGGGSGGGNSSSLAMRVGLILGGAVVLIIIIVVLSSLLSGPSNIPHLLTVAEDQNELVNLATTGTQDATEAVTQNFSQNCALSMQSAQGQLINFITSHGGGKPGSKTLALKQNPATDTALSNANASSTFDSTYINVMQNQLNVYKSDLNTAYKNSQNTAEKQLLANDYTDAQLLLQELNSPNQ